MSRNNRISVSVATRTALLGAGLLMMALGIVLCIRAGLGITPISCPPYVLSLGLPLTVGQFTIIMHFLLIMGQALLLGRSFRRVEWLQIPLALVFGMFIDGWMSVTYALVSSSYMMQLAILLAGNFMMAAGMRLEIRSSLLLVPTDGFVQAVSRRTGRPFARIKMLFDVSLLLFSIVCSWLLLSRIAGVREGTVISAFLVGMLLNMMTSLDVSRQKKS